MSEDRTSERVSRLEFNQGLAERICAYWEIRGYTVKAEARRTEPVMRYMRRNVVPFQPQYFVVRSDMVNGYPRDWSERKDGE